VVEGHSRNTVLEIDAQGIDRPAKSGYDLHTEKHVIGNMNVDRV
jgi:predicted Zn-dependent protease